MLRPVTPRLSEARVVASLVAKRWWQMLLHFALMYAEDTTLQHPSEAFVRVP
jgi:hypothetical protein